jgi:glutathione peroxidase
MTLNMFRTGDVGASLSNAFVRRCLNLAMAMIPNLNDIPLTTLDGRSTALGAYAGQVALVVNVASQCGFTPQYVGLEALYRRYQHRGFVVLGFPCDQFGAQEPGDAKEIENFCSLTYDVTFPLFAKTDVNGENAHPLYKALKAASPELFGAQGIEWNFTKFLIDRRGQFVARFASKDEPITMMKDIEALLGACGA